MSYPDPHPSLIELIMETVSGDDPVTDERGMDYVGDVFVQSYGPWRDRPGDGQYSWYSDSYHHPSKH